MKKHVKKMMDYYGYGEQDFIRCFVCGSQASDCHHVVYRSQGGTDDVDNLCFLCRSCHDRSHFKKEPYLYEEELKEIVSYNMKFTV